MNNSFELMGAGRPDVVQIPRHR